LIGMATGARSGLSVLDIDRKHAEAITWWRVNHRRLLPSRTYETRSGGLHVWFRHTEGVTNTVGRLAPGVDTRGDGGYVVIWFAAGFACLDPTEPAPWPPWLLAAIKPPPQARMTPCASVNPDAAIAGVLRRLVGAREGERNNVVFWAARTLVRKGLGQGEVQALLVPVALDLGLPAVEIRRTIRSAIMAATRAL
jgi:hypothetical protein